MIRKSEYFEQTSKFLDSELSQSELNEFEAQLEVDSDLAEELNLHLEMQKALGESDVIGLRNKLAKITQNQTDTETTNSFDSFNFGLTEELSSYKNMDRSAYDEDILNFEHSFPKIHLYQHKIAGKENIHQFYKEQGEVDSVNESETLSPYDEALFKDIQNALEENDIAEIRASLKQIAQSIPAHSYSAEQIEDYVSDGMNTELLSQFEEDLILNTSLANDVRLSREINLAGAEFDIMDLRANLQEIQQSESHSTVRIEKMEAYIHNELSDEELASFEAELSSNRELISEINLIKDIDRALNETDVMQLRNKLQRISGDAAEIQTERSFAVKTKIKKVMLSSVAASLILLLGITGLLSRQASQKDIYQNFYSKYQTTGIARSANLSADQTLITALQKFDNKDYDAALNLFQKVISADQNNMVGHFYTGVSLQETGKYNNAIREYQTVIANKDNLFVEQAEWYIGLCYLQTNEDKKAYKQFKKIAKNDGFYQAKAQSILRKLKYSD